MQDHRSKLEIIPDELVWIDLINPSAKEVYKLSKTYHLDKKFLRDSLEPEHLPKLDRIGRVFFMILRAFDEQSTAEADSVRSLTRKLAIFYGAGFVLTIHRTDMLYIHKLREKWYNEMQLLQTSHHNAQELQYMLIHDLVEAVTNTYQWPMEDYFDQLENLETALMAEVNAQIDLRAGHYLKRKNSLIKRMLRMHVEVVDKLTNLAPPTMQDHFKYAKGHLEKWYIYADDLSENISGLLSHNVALASQRTNEASHHTNEVVQTLTVISLFFLPLNLIVGFFGMNFADIPGYQSPWGKWLAVGLLVSVTLMIYFWIRKKQLIK
jgi:magnesium transporter